MSDLMMIDVSTSKGAAMVKKELGKRAQRSDFPATPEGWTKFCQYQIGLHTRAKGRAERSLKYWESVQKGEHLAAAVMKANAATELATELAAKNDELAKLKAELAKLQSKKQ